MSDERKEVIAELNREIESINNVAVIRYILYVVQAFKRKWGVL